MLQYNISVMLNPFHFPHLTVTERASAGNDMWECQATGHPVPNGGAGWEEERGRTSWALAELLLARTCGFSKLSLYKKHKRKSEILVLAPLCQERLHKPQWGVLCPHKNKIIFTFSNLTRVNTEPIYWEHWCTTLCYLIQVPLPSLVGLYFIPYDPLKSPSSYIPVPHIWVYMTLWSFTRSTWQQ